MTAPNGRAEALASDPLLNELLDDMERAAFERCVNAKPSDDETRRTATTEVRAIQSLRQQLQSLSRGKTTPAARGSVA